LRKRAGLPARIGVVPAARLGLLNWFVRHASVKFRPPSLPDTLKCYTDCDNGTSLRRLSIARRAVAFAARSVGVPGVA
jgi:hypothetical protein